MDGNLMLAVERQHRHKFKMKSYLEPLLVETQNENIFQSERGDGEMSKIEKRVDFAVLVN